MKKKDELPDCPVATTVSLRSLEADGIITRTVFPEVPPRVEYALSGLGEEMRPILKAMETFGQNYKKHFVALYSFSLCE